MREGQSSASRPAAAPALSPRPRSLSALRRQAADCRECPLWRPATQVVFGEGASNARLMLVGEQPGDHEDLAAKPFVGPAGALLGSGLRVGRDRGRLLASELAPAALLTAHPSAVLRGRDAQARSMAHAALVNDLKLADSACS